MIKYTISTLKINTGQRNNSQQLYKLITIIMVKLTGKEAGFIEETLNDLQQITLNYNSKEKIEECLSIISDSIRKEFEELLQDEDSNRKYDKKEQETRDFNSFLLTDLYKC